MATKIISVGTVHIQYDDTIYRVDDTVNDPNGYWNIRVISGNGLVARIYNPYVIYWHQPPASGNWVGVPNTLHMKVTLP